MRNAAGASEKRQRERKLSAEGSPSSAGLPPPRPAAFRSLLVGFVCRSPKEPGRETPPRRTHTAHPPEPILRLFQYLRAAPLTASLFLAQLWAGGVRAQGLRRLLAPKPNRGAAGEPRARLSPRRAPGPSSPGAQGRAKPAPERGPAGGCRQPRVSFPPLSFPFSLLAFPLLSFPLLLAGFAAFARLRGATGGSRDKTAGLMGREKLGRGFKTEMCLSH